MTRAEARTKIIQTANRHSPLRINGVLPLLGPRQLQRCVSIVRNRQLVKPDVLTAAGFNEHGPHYRPGRTKAAA